MVLKDIPIGIGTWAWGDRRFWGYGRSYGEQDLKEAFDAALSSGVRCFDTAETYGQGQSETLLGCFLQEPRESGESSASGKSGKSGASTGSGKAGGSGESSASGMASESGQSVYVATKFMPFPWRISASSLAHALRRSLTRLGLAHVDLYQIHWPMPPRPPESWMEPLARAVEQGLIREVGVSNYSAAQTRRAQEALARHGIPLASNQVEYNLAQRKIERNGVLETCRNLGVRVIAYSPLAMGVLSGKYTPENPPSGARAFLYRKGKLRRMRPLLELLAEIARSRGRTSSQVALNWLMQKGTLPIPGVKNAAQATEVAGALGWSLTRPELERLDAASSAFG